MTAILLIATIILAIAVGVLAQAVRGGRRSRSAILAELRGDEAKRTRQIIDRAHDAYVEMDQEGNVVEWNAAAETMFGWPRAEALGRTVAELVIPEDYRQAHAEGLARFLETGRGKVVGPRTELTAAHRDGSEIPIEISVTAIGSVDSGFSFHAFVRDITERKLLELQQSELLMRGEDTARVDPLTGLPNRRAWDQELDRELARARRVRQRLCVALLDLDRFKAFNDAHGHRSGDSLLRRAGSAWKLAVRTSDFVARYGGEEFAVLLPDCPIDEAIAVIERLRDVTPDQQTVSAGIAEWNGYEAVEALIDRADLALYQAKRDGRDRAVAAA